MSKRAFATAFPWTGRQRFFEPGEMRLAILSMLAECPKHGYQLMKEMEHRSGGLYRASAGSTYPTLQQLESEGMVEAEMQSGRRVYRLTRAGRKELASDPVAVKRLLAGVVSHLLGIRLSPCLGHLANVVRIGGPAPSGLLAPLLTVLFEIG